MNLNLRFQIQNPNAMHLDFLKSLKFKIILSDIQIHKAVNMYKAEIIALCL